MRVVIDVSYNFQWADIHHWDDPGGYIIAEYKERYPAESVTDFKERL